MSESIQQPGQLQPKSPPAVTSDAGASEAAVRPAPPLWASYLTLAALVIYTLMLCWLAVDRVFDLGVFEPKRDSDPLAPIERPLPR